MDELRGMKLVKRLGDANLAVNITVNFDKTKHLSESTIKRRNVVRERFIAKDRIKEEEEKRKQEDELMKKERERLSYAFCYFYLFSLFIYLDNILSKLNIC